MKQADYKDGMYVSMRKAADAAVYVTRSRSGFVVGIQEADVARAKVQYTDLKLIEPATEEQLSQ